MAKEVELNKTNDVFLTRQGIELYNLISKENTKIYWHLLTKVEKYHCNRLFSFGLLEKKPVKIRVNNKNKTCFELVLNEKAHFNPILDEEY